MFLLSFTFLFFEENILFPLRFYYCHSYTRGAVISIYLDLELFHFLSSKSYLLPLRFNIDVRCSILFFLSSIFQESVLLFLDSMDLELMLLHPKAGQMVCGGWLLLLLLFAFDHQKCEILLAPLFFSDPLQDYQYFSSFLSLDQKDFRSIRHFIEFHRQILN